MKTAAAICCLLLLIGCAQSQAAQLATPEPTSIATVTARPTDVPTLVPSATPTRTPTPVPTATPTATAIPATATPTLAPTPEALRYVFPIKAEQYSVSSSHHDYPASDIACPIGSEFVAVTSGVVDFVSRVDRWPQTGKDADKGGLSVAIIGDDGLRYYGSHLSEVAEGIEPGVRVEAGQLLGLTGDTGNAAGVYPHLHFGISRPTTPDDWQVRRGEIWPQKYLKAWERGKNITPKILPS